MLRPLALDTETELFGPCNMAPRLVCVSVDAGAWQSLMHHTQCVDYVAEILERPDVLIIGHSIAYDMCVLAEHEPWLMPKIFRAYDANRVTDTEIRQKLIDIAEGIYRGFDDEDGEPQKITYQLEDVAARLLRRTLDKNTWRLRYGELRDLPTEAWPEGARIYPLEDARATRDVFSVQEGKIHYLDDQFRQARAAFWIKLMTNWGIHTDAQGVFELAERTQADYERIAADLRAVGLLRHDKLKRDGTIKEGARDTKKARALIVSAFEAKGKDYPRTKTGLPALGKKACANSLHPDLIKYAALSSTKKLLSTDIPLLEQGCVQPIHVYCEVLVETGRTSMRPNLQNQKRKGGLRECFVPRPGTYFVSSDYGGLELCTLAEVCYTVLGYSALGDALNAGKDPHLMVACQILGCDYEWAKAVNDKGKGDDNPEYGRIDDARQTGKVANFGFPGGLGAAALVHFAENNYGVILTEEQARELKRVWLATWPEMRAYFNFVNSLIDVPEPIIRHIASNRYRGGLSYTEACNSFFQGLGADIAKSAGWEIAKGCYLDQDSPLFGCRIVNFVHDEFILEAPQHRAHEAALELTRLMIAAAEPWLKHVKIKSKPVVMKRWSKDAKQIWKDGRLEAWDRVAA